MTKGIEHRHKGIAHASITAVGSHVIGVDHNGNLCKMSRGGRWLRLALTEKRPAPPPRRKYPGHPALNVPGN